MLYYPYMTSASKNKKNIQSQAGDNIKFAREKQNLTQEEVAKKAGISTNYYAKIERGEVNTTLEKLHKIIRALGTDVSDIIPS